jgi:hypothetical protein
MKKAVATLGVGLILAMHVDISSGATASETADIAEAVFTQQIKYSENLAIFCLAIDHADPSLDFLARFNNIGGGKRALPMSGCISGDEVEREGIKEISSQKPAVLLVVSTDSIVWKDALTVEISGGYCTSNKSAAMYVYTVKKKDEKWVVARERLKFII